MKYAILISVCLFFFGCFSPKQDSIDNVIEKSLDKKEGVDIQITPVKEKL